MPRFLLAEEPQDRVFKYIYSPHYLSLVLIIPEEIATVTSTKTQSRNLVKLTDMGARYLSSYWFKIMWRLQEALCLL